MKRFWMLLSVTLLATGLMITGCYDAEGSLEVPGKVATPTASVPGGIFLVDEITVSLASATSGAKIYYTINGTAPTTESTLFAAATPIKISRTTTIRAFAVADDLIDSGALSVTYTFPIADSEFMLGYDLISEIELAEWDAATGKGIIKGELFEEIRDDFSDGAFRIYFRNASGANRNGWGIGTVGNQGGTAAQTIAIMAPNPFPNGAEDFVDMKVADILDVITKDEIYFDITNACLILKIELWDAVDPGASMIVFIDEGEEDLFEIENISVFVSGPHASPFSQVSPLRGDDEGFIHRRGGALAQEYVAFRVDLSNYTLATLGMFGEVNFVFEGISGDVEDKEFILLASTTMPTQSLGMDPLNGITSSVTAGIYPISEKAEADDTGLVKLNLKVPEVLEGVAELYFIIYFESDSSAIYSISDITFELEPPASIAVTVDGDEKQIEVLSVGAANVKHLLTGDGYQHFSNGGSWGGAHSYFKVDLGARLDTFDTVTIKIQCTNATGDSFWGKNVVLFAGKTEPAPGTWQVSGSGLDNWPAASSAQINSVAFGDTHGRTAPIEVTFNIASSLSILDSNELYFIIFLYGSMDMEYIITDISFNK